MPIALILVDALSPAYVSPATLPAVCDLARDGRSEALENSYAYRGIEATLFSGRSQREHGVWGEFRPARQPAQPGLLDRLALAGISLGDLLPSDRLRLDARYVIARLRQPNQRLGMGNLIPAALIPRFVSSIERPIWEEGSLGSISTIFDDLRAAGLSFEIVGHPLVAQDREIAGYAAAVLAHRRPDFWYIKFSALDALGHRFGPDVERLRPALKQFDRQLADLIAALRSGYPGGEVDIVVVSDHGMSQVDGTLDVRPLLQRLAREAKQHLLYFLDSTTIRVWSEHTELLSGLAASFAQQPQLRVLDQAARRELLLPEDSSTGDLMVAIEEGQVIFPDFFRRQRPPRGMHGYARVRTQAGLPFLAVASELAALLPEGRLTHASLWAALRGRLGLERAKSSQPGEGRPCISLS